MKKNNFASSVLFVLSLVVFITGLIIGALFIFALHIAITIWILSVVLWAILYGIAELLELLQGISDELHRTNQRLDSLEQVDEEPVQSDQGPSSILTILGYTENYLDNPEVEVLMDGEIIGRVKHKGTLIIEVKKDCDLLFSVMMKYTEIHVFKDKTKVLQVSMAYKTLSVKNVSETL